MVAGCYVTPGGFEPLVTPQPVIQIAAAPGGSPSGGGPIEAGCSFNATQLQGAPGATFQIACPSGCESNGGLWGTDVYTADSGICRAGIHAGAISPAGGIVVVQIQPGRPAYRGSSRYNVTSSDYGNYGLSFAVIAPAGQASVAPPQPAAPQVIEAGCSFNSTQIHDAMGSAHLVSCPPGCADQGGLWGTDVYTGDSGICRAAIHSGLIATNGGPVVVILDAGRPAYRGTVRYGIRSSDYGSYPSSFRLQHP
jgi:LCCL domain